MRISQETKSKLVKIAKGAVVAAVGAAVVNLGQALQVTSWSPEVLPWVQAVAAVLVNVGRLFAKV